MGVIFKNNVLYGAGDIEISPICYSEEEQEIGCWTDGKPLYQRTLFYTGDTIITVSGNSSTAYTVAGITNIYISDILPTLDQLIHYQIDLTYDGNEKNIYQFEYCFQASTGTFLRSHNPGISYIGYNITPGSSITLQYTKTTDQPGSGTWTPSGVPAVHYSTDEQVVGTWIDGSTLYEKTLVKNNINMNPVAFVDISSLGVDVCFGDLSASYYIVSNVKRSFLKIEYEDDEGALALTASANHNASTLYITIRYTKSTS